MAADRFRHDYGAALVCELGAQPGDDVWNLTDDEAIESCVATLGPLVPDVRTKVIGASVLRQPLGYPVFALGYENDRAALARDGTGIHGLYSIGRNGEYDHILIGRHLLAPPSTHSQHRRAAPTSVPRALAHRGDLVRPALQRGDRHCRGSFVNRPASNAAIESRCRSSQPTSSL